MASEIIKLARRIRALESTAIALSAAPQLAHSSIMDGAVDQKMSFLTGYDDMGNPVFEERLVSRYGQQDDGSNTVSSFEGPTPPRPVGFTVTGGAGYLAVEWFGEFEDRFEPYLDHDYVAVHVGTSSGFTPMADTLKGTLRASQGESLTVGGLAAGTYFVTLVAVSVAGVWGPASPYGTGAPGESGGAGIDVTARQMAQDALDAAGTAAADAAAASSAANAANNAAIAAQADATAALLSADGKTRLWYATVPPASQGADGDMWWQRDPDTGLVSHVYERRGGLWEERTITSAVIDSITAGQITTGTLNAATIITVGDVAAEHLTIGQSSLQVFRPNPDGDLVATINVGGGDGDNLIILDPVSGATKAGFNSDGNGVARSFDVDSLTVGGVSVTDMLQSFAQGLKASMKIAATRPAIGTSEYGLYEVAATLPSGRVYKVRFVSNFTHGSANGAMRLWLRSTTDGTPPTTTSSQLIMGWNGFAVANLPYRHSIDMFFHVGLTPGYETQMRVLVSAATLGGVANIYYDTKAPGFFTIEDVGPINETFMTDGTASGGGGSSSGGTPEPPPATSVQTYTQTVMSSWTRCWRSGNIRSDTDAVQGTLSGATSYSQIGFPTSLYTALNGSTVQKIEVYLYANHWYSSSGGAGVIGVHGAITPPESFSYSGQLTVPNWAAGSPKWVTLPSAWHAGFASGSTRGITLGGGASSSAVFYGRFNGTGASSGKPGLRITYTK